jgi:hypothetical protein
MHRKPSTVPPDNAYEKGDEGKGKNNDADYAVGFRADTVLRLGAFLPPCFGAVLLFEFDLLLAI